MDRRYYRAAEKFAQKYRKRKDVIGILIVGSILMRKPDKNSDVDVQIILDKSETRTRGNTEVDGIEIEYFINPVEQIRSYLKKEQSRHTAHMLTHSLVLYQRGNVLDKLIAEARIAFRKKLPPLSGVKKKLAVYALDDLQKDLEDVQVKKDEASVRLLCGKLLDKCVDVYFAVKRLPREKDKRLLETLRNIDSVFAKLVENATSHRYGDVIKLVAYTEKLLGGKRAKNWELKGSLEL